MQAAIAASKRSAEEDAARSKRGQGADADFEEAMRLSREDDERRRRDVDSQPGGALFDDP
jgi:epsin